MKHIVSVMQKITIGKKGEKKKKQIIIKNNERYSRDAKNIFRYSARLKKIKKTIENI